MSSALAMVSLLIGSLVIVALINASGSRAFKFPFLFSAVWVAFVLLGFVGFIQSSGDLFQNYNRSGVIDIALFMMATSISGGLLGYALAGGGRARPRNASVPMTVRRQVIRRMNFASFVVAAMSYSAFFLLAGLGGGLRQYIFYSGAYTVSWEGLPVYLVFIVRFIYVAIVIQLWIWSRTKKPLHLKLAIAFSLIPLINIIFIFRRAELLTLAIYFGYFVANYTKVHIRRPHVIAAVMLMVLVMQIFPILRSEAGKRLSYRELFEQALAPRATYDTSEIGSGLFRIYQSMSQNSFEYGGIFWNALVKQFLPSRLFGGEFKRSLMLGRTEYIDTTFASFKYYVSPMGFAQAYQQFWLFGGLIFLVIGFIVARLEQKRFVGPRQEIFLVLMIPFLLSTVSADLSLIVSRSVTYAILMLICIPRVPAAQMVPFSQVYVQQGRPS